MGAHRPRVDPHRHGRHLILPGFGAAAQERLGAASVLMVGVGGLGCPAALYLGAAGVGRITLVDPDTVEASNLHRQVLYGPADVGRPKADVARQRLLAQQPDLQVDAHAVALSPDNAAGLLRGHDLVLDGTDDPATRYLVHDACRRAGIPLVQGGVVGYEGQVAVHRGDGPCLRCLHPWPAGPAGACREEGVLGPVPGVVGTLMAVEAVKAITGVGHPMEGGRMLLYDGLEGTFEEVTWPRDPGCPLCGDSPRVPEPPPQKTDAPRTTWAQVHAWASEGRPFTILDVRAAAEAAGDPMPGARAVPADALARSVDSLDRDRPVVVCCAQGIRSRQAAAWLRRHGIDAWSLEGGAAARPPDYSPAQAGARGAGMSASKRNW